MLSLYRSAGLCEQRATQQDPTDKSRTQGAEVSAKTGKLCSVACSVRSFVRSIAVGFKASSNRNVYTLTSLERLLLSELVPCGRSLEVYLQLT